MEVLIILQIVKQTRKELSSNIILAGGGACMNGLSERLDYELSKRLNSVRNRYIDLISLVIQTKDLFNRPYVYSL